ncbi:MAG: GNAT family N-acetyltransferase [Proteobacteria bacterium]|nr:MAG: GNAT family N-acetyltransferase [Pseudomonadota bacterium]
MILRRATIADLALLRFWDGKPHVVAARGHGGGDDWEGELTRTLPWLELMIAEEAGRPVGVIRIIDPADEETHYWGDCAPNLRAIDIWIGEESDLGQGLGSIMMQLALAHCFRDPCVQAVLIDPLASNTRAHRFYERLGFRRVERRLFGPDDCLVLRLDRDCWRPGGAGG